MSDYIKHECGIALIRLLKPLEYYGEKYNTPLYGINKLHLLMQKQRNRGQDGAGIASLKLNVKPGTRYINRRRSNGSQPLKDIFDYVYKRYNKLFKNESFDIEYFKKKYPFAGELLLGHLRYGTHGDNGIETVHPILRKNNYISRNLILAGNFNLTNVDDLFKELVEYGQYPQERSDTITILEKIGHFLDEEVQRLFTWFKSDGLSNVEINDLIFDHLDVQRFLQRATKKFDGGYALMGLIGHGDAFVLRDPNGIRPVYYYFDNEVVVVASERPAIQTTFDTPYRNVQELPPGHAIIIKRNGKVSIKEVNKTETRKSCSFERIYFSRGTDKEIYLERKNLGKNLVDEVLKAINYDFKSTVFSFVPNTAETAFFGLIKELDRQLNKIKQDKILNLNEITPKKLEKILSLSTRVEKIVVKDAKLRTFIADVNSRQEMVSHVYDVTYGIVKNNKDTLVLLDDSIVRGTTLKESIITIVSRLHPKKIVIVSSAPQIRYPDCYGIDMSKMNDFIAFKALVSLLEENGKENILEDTYEKCKAQEYLPSEKIQNEVIALYDEFSYEEISQKIAELVTPVDVDVKVEVIYQTLEGLREACSGHDGDWYFSGIYPTPGGNKVVNKAFINFMEGKNVRAY